MKANEGVASTLAGTIIPLILASIIICLRLYSRYLIKNFGWDDALICVAWFFALVVVTLLTVQTRYGLGQHYNYPYLQYRPEAIAVSYATLACYQVCLVTTKLSILLFYLRILRLPAQQTVCKYAMVFVTVYGSILFILTFFLCNPFYGGYEFDVRVGHCLSYYPSKPLSTLHETTVSHTELIFPSHDRLRQPPHRRGRLPHPPRAPPRPQNEVTANPPEGWSGLHPDDGLLRGLREPHQNERHVAVSGAAVRDVELLLLHGVDDAGRQSGVDLRERADAEASGAEDDGVEPEEGTACAQPGRREAQWWLGRR
jgi:hypothetical protein